MVSYTDHEMPDIHLIYWVAQLQWTRNREKYSDRSVPCHLLFATLHDDCVIPPRSTRTRFLIILYNMNVETCRSNTKRRTNNKVISRIMCTSS